MTVERDSAFMVFTQRPKDTNVDRWLADLPRCLFQSGVPPSDIEGFYTKADVDYILEQYLWHLRPRPGFKQMLETLTRGGIEFHACSGAKPERLQSYFKDAGISIPEDRICDMAPVVGVHKPQLAVYKEVYKRHAVEGTPIIFGGTSPSAKLIAHDQRLTHGISPGPSSADLSLRTLLNMSTFKTRGCGVSMMWLRRIWPSWGILL